MQTMRLAFGVSIELLSMRFTNCPHLTILHRLELTARWHDWLGMDITMSARLSHLIGWHLSRALILSVSPAPAMRWTETSTASLEPLAPLCGDEFSGLVGNG